MEKFKLNLQMFADITNGTYSSDVGNDLSVEMKTYYSDYLIDNATPYLVHDQFAQKHPIPKNGGKTIEFRRYSRLPQEGLALVEGVTPDGGALDVSKVEATVAQYGYFLRMTDQLLLTAIDNNQVQATKLLGQQAGQFLDSVTRDVLVTGTNVIYAANSGTRATKRTEITASHLLKVQDIFLAANTLKNQNSRPIDGDFVSVVHPNIAYDLMMNDANWVDWHKYEDSKAIFEGEIGKIGNVRFVESTNAKVFKADDIPAGMLINNVGGYSGAITSVTFDGATVAEDALIGKKIQINGVDAVVTDNTASTLTFASTDFGTISDNDPISGGGAGAAGADVYATLVFGADAYGVTEIEGGGLEYFAKQLGSAGAADPLNQRATSGWKAMKTAEILSQEYMVRLESGCSL